MENTRIPKYDKERLFADADAFEICRSMGIRMDRCGSTVYIPCVSSVTDYRHDMEKSRMNHMQLKKYGCICYKCNTSYNITGLIQSYYEVEYGQSLSYPETLQVLAKNMPGGEDQYIISGKAEHGSKLTKMPLTKQEMELLGLNPYSCEDYIVACGNKNVVVHDMNLTSFFRKKPELFKQYVVTRADEVMRFYSILINTLSEANTQKSIRLALHAKKEFAIIKDLCERYGGKSYVFG